MRRIDKYILTLFLQILLFSVFSFTVIFIIFDMIAVLGDFMNKDVPFPVIIKYFVFNFPNIFVSVLPASTLMASLFSIGHLSKRNEFDAMRASGFSLGRIILPVIMTAFFISIFSIVLTEKVVPSASGKRLNIYEEYIKKNSPNDLLKTKEIYFEETTNRVVAIQSYDQARQTGNRVNFTYRSNNTITKIVHAKTMVWEDNVWILNDVVIRTFNGENDNVTEYELLPYPDLTFTNEDLNEINLEPSEMSFFQLKRLIKRRKRLGEDVNKWLVELMLKISLPFSNLIIVLFSIPLAIKIKRTGKVIGYGMSIALVICFLFY